MTNNYKFFSALIMNTKFFINLKTILTKIRYLYLKLRLKCFCSFTTFVHHPHAQTIPHVTWWISYYYSYMKIWDSNDKFFFTIYRGQITKFVPLQRLFSTTWIYQVEAMSRWTSINLLTYLVRSYCFPCH